MRNYKMAWRNLWRNRRRTIITAASVFFAVFFALLMRSLQLGSYDYMFRNMIESYSGYIQVQHDDFWEDRVVDNAVTFPEETKDILLADANVSETIPRFESFALASSGSRSKGVMVMGIDPEKEKLLSDVEKKLVRYRLSDEAIAAIKQENIPRHVMKNLDLFRDYTYSGDAALKQELGIRDTDTAAVMPAIRKHAREFNNYIKAGRAGALVGDRLASYLGLSRGDTLVLIGQGYHGATAAGLFRVEGIVRLPTPEIDSRIVYLPVDICQELYSAPGMLTSVILQVNDKDDDAIGQTIENLQHKLKKPYRVLGWKEMNETIVNQMDADNKSGMIMIGILYLVIAFGVFGTVLMMTAERRREFGVLVSIGMQKSKLAAVMVYEMLFVGLLGILAGIAVALPSIIYGYYHPIRFSSNMARIWEDYGFEPIMAFKWIGSYFVWQSVVVGLIVLVAVIYPVRKILKLNEVNALKA